MSNERSPIAEEDLPQAQERQLDLAVVDIDSQVAPSKKGGLLLNTNKSNVYLNPICRPCRY